MENGKPGSLRKTLLDPAVLPHEHLEACFLGSRGTHGSVYEKSVHYTISPVHGVFGGRTICSTDRGLWETRGGW